MPAEPAGSHTGTATILFTDLVGSTAQRAQLGEEAAEALRRTHDRLLADAVAAHHGTVAKSVGDGIMATFPGAADAVAAAVAHPLTPMLADLRREAGVERVSLHGLDDAAVETPVATVARHELDEALVALAHTVRRETEGNPFFIGEVIRHLGESGALFQESGRWTYRGAIAGLGIPEGVREVIGRRLGRLSETTNRVLGLAAVIGRQFDVALLWRGYAPRWVRLRRPASRSTSSASAGSTSRRTGGGPRTW